MHSRIKQVRESLNLSQREFGEKLGVSRDVISNIEYNRVEPKPLLISHLCTTYNVNKDWLDTGHGTPFNNVQIKENKALDEAVEIFKELSPNLQDYALKQIKGLLDLQNSAK